MLNKRITSLLAAAIFAASGSAAVAGEITVSAAASLTNAFKELAEQFEAQHPDTKVQLNFAGSGALLQQMAKGAPVDVFASADQETMDQAEQQNLLAKETRQDFVRNSLVVITPADSPLTLNTLADLEADTVQRIAISNPASVPVGRYTQQALSKSQQWDALQTKVINTQNVRQSLDYVARDEVDTGFVYATDAAIMADKVKVQFEVPLDVVISYPIAVTKEGAEKTESQQFVDFIFTPESQKVFSKYGFSQP